MNVFVCEFIYLFPIYYLKQQNTHTHTQTNNKRQKLIESLLIDAR